MRKIDTTLAQLNEVTGWELEGFTHGLQVLALDRGTLVELGTLGESEAAELAVRAGGA